MLENFPNPFNPLTQIRYELPSKALVALDVYNITGQHVASLVKEEQHAGLHSVTWDGTTREGQGAVSGVYVYRLRAGNRVESRKMLLLR